MPICRYRRNLRRTRRPFRPNPFGARPSWPASSSSILPNRHIGCDRLLLANQHGFASRPRDDCQQALIGLHLSKTVAEQGSAACGSALAAVEAIGT